MNFALIDENRIVLNIIVAEPSDVFPEGTWVECPYWVGIGMSIDTPEPEPTPIPLADEQPVSSGSQTI